MTSLRLRDLPGEVRVVLAAFLVLAAGGYAAALVQVEYQSVGARELYAGPAEPPRSRVERVLEAEHGPFNGIGTMRPAFTTRSRGWDALTRGRSPDEVRALTAEREGERLALLAWVRAGADRAAYDRDDFPLGPGMAGQPVTPDLVAGPGRVKVRTLIDRRCADCHSEDGREDRARVFPFDTYDRLKPYLDAPAPVRMSVPKLAQTTHAHLFGLAVVYAATGVLFCYTGAPRGAKFVLAPLPLVAQGVGVACWWLARWDPGFAWGVTPGGAAAGLGFAAHVAGGLWELTGLGRVATRAEVG